MAACPAGVIIELDGKPRAAQYGLPRADVPPVIRTSRCDTTGFSWGIPAAQLGKGPHELVLKALTPDGKGFYRGNRAVRFRVE